LRAAVIDSGPLINLAHLELVIPLSLFFDVIYIPISVQREVNVKHRFRYRLRKLFESGRFARCMSADKVNVELLTAELGEGEAEAIVQGQEKNTAVFIGDERRARSIAKAKGLKPVGTVAILARLQLEGFAEGTRELVAKLRRDLDFRVTNSIVEECIAKAGEPI
jgi:predicted nucleic acid-binding protein